MKTLAQFYRDRSGLYRWRLKAANLEIIAESGQGYTRAQSCIDGFARVKEAFNPDADTIILFDKGWSANG